MRAESTRRVWWPQRRPRADWWPRRRLADERGETLIELLVTITIVSVAIVGLVASLGALLKFSSRDRSDTDIEVILTSYAENLEGLAYEPCGASTPYDATAPDALPDPPGVDLQYADAVAPSADVTSSFLVRIDSVKYWNGQLSPAGFQTACPGGGDPGLQEITVRAWKVSDSGGIAQIAGTAGQTLVFYKREA